VKLRSVYELPPDKQRALRRARRIAWWSLFWQGSVAGLMFAVAGSSQTMKIAWIEDTLSMVPALVFLITEGFRGRQPNRRFPYGYNRVPGMAFLAASVALVLFGLFLAIDSLATLSSHEHPSIKPMSVLGISVWSGWIMIAALVYSIFPPVILGYKKLHLAKELHDKPSTSTPRSTVPTG
jgi:divalent metal cation (Fe/Co/Zn/Cd) transporter